MSSSVRRAVLTGVGLITPLGLDRASFWNSLRDGRSGIERIQSFDPSALPTQFGGEVRGFDPRDYIEKKDRKRLNQMVRTFQFAVAGAHLALADARIDKGRLDPGRFGVIFGSATIPGDLAELGPAAREGMAGTLDRVDLQRWGERGIPCIPPTWMLNHIPNMMASHVSILHDAQGPNNTITQSDAAGLLALGEAFRHICRGRADLFLVGGADTKTNPITLARHCLFAPLSRRNDDPTRASRPFDRQRDGMVVGEGAGILVLEELDHARRRGARIYAEVLGCGAAFDRDRTGRGLARAIRIALHQAQLGPEQLGHVNAHGSGTVDGDAWEARGLIEALGERGSEIPVFAAKSYIGNLGAAAATVELAASLLALEHRLLPRTLNFEYPDPSCPVRVCSAPQPCADSSFLKISMTELGQCAAVVCRPWD